MVRTLLGNISCFLPWIICSSYFPACLMGHTWFISCLFFMKLLPQKWQVPVFLVMVPRAGLEVWPSKEELLLSGMLCGELGSRLGSRDLLTRERGCGVR